MIVCFVGDSIVNGVNDPEALGWVGRLQAAARSKGCIMTGYNLGIRRSTSAEVLSRWQQETKRREMPGMSMRLVFSFGVADMVLEDGAPRLTLDESVKNARAVLEPAAASCPTLFIGPPIVADPVFTARLEALSEAYAALCADIGVPYLPLLPELKEAELYLDELVQGDGVHPGPAGYSNIFRLVDSWDAWRAWLPRPE